MSKTPLTKILIMIKKRNSALILAALMVFWRRLQTKMVIQQQHSHYLAPILVTFKDVRLAPGFTGKRNSSNRSSLSNSGNILLSYLSSATIYSRILRMKSSFVRRTKTRQRSSKWLIRFSSSRTRIVTELIWFTLARKILETFKKS